MFASGAAVVLGAAVAVVAAVIAAPIAVPLAAASVATVGAGCLIALGIQRHKLNKVESEMLNRESDVAKLVARINELQLALGKSLVELREIRADFEAKMYSNPP